MIKIDILGLICIKSDLILVEEGLDEARYLICIKSDLI